MADETIVSISGLYHELGRFSLELPSLTLEPGLVLGLLGRNGAGKSTTLGALLGLVRPRRGDITVLGLPVRTAAVEIRRRVGYVPEQAAFYDNLNARQTAALLEPFYPTWDRRLLEDYFARLEIDPRKPVRIYSKGMRVKLALALAMAHHPELLVLDEPTAGLDPVVRQEVIADIAGLVRDGKHGAIISSHITSDLAVADYIAILEDGRLIEYDDREQLAERWRKVSGTVELPGAEPGNLFVVYRRDGDGFSGVTRSFSADWQRRVMQQGLRIELTAQMTLDEILAHATGRGTVAAQGGEAA